ncbi:MAG: glucose-1-phosphate thymidylyltransferase RfbA [Chloroflexi bacterium]|nr:glucose-1-phosphate thymidylyltransferase RfbA [Chloroflexota bacterium]
MKGIILAAGRGTRLYPITQAVCKQLLPVYNKPMVYYPLSMLMLAGITEVLVITNPEDHGAFTRLLGDGSQWGLQIRYAEQPKPNGLAEAFIIGEEFIGDDPVCLILGDNIFYGTALRTLLKEAAMLENGALIFAYLVSDPQRYGVVDFDAEGNVLSIEEKPANPRSNYAIPGIYFYDNQVISYAKGLRPSERGEMEITDLNNIYLKTNDLKVLNLGRGVAWLDAGTHESLLQAAQFIYTVEERQGLLISSPDEIAFIQGWITESQLQQNIDAQSPSEYSSKLTQFLRLYGMEK